MLNTNLYTEVIGHTVNMTFGCVCYEYQVKYQPIYRGDRTPCKYDCWWCMLWIPSSNTNIYTEEIGHPVNMTVGGVCYE